MELQGKINQITVAYKNRVSEHHQQNVNQTQKINCLEESNKKIEKQNRDLHRRLSGKKKPSSKRAANSPKPHMRPRRKTPASGHTERAPKTAKPKKMEIEDFTSTESSTDQNNESDEQRSPGYIQVVKRERDSPPK